MCALALNSGGGGNTRFSRSVESISWLATGVTGNEDMQDPLGKRYLRGARHAKGRRRPKDASWMTLYRETRTLGRSEEHTSELQSLRHLVCRLLLEKNNNTK